MLDDKAAEIREFLPDWISDEERDRAELCVRIDTQREWLVELIEALLSPGGADEAKRDLQRVLDARRFVLESQFHEGPLAIPPAQVDEGASDLLAALRTGMRTVAEHTGRLPHVEAELPDLADGLDLLAFAKQQQVALIELTPDEPAPDS
jgi:hypothetical protein